MTTRPACPIPGEHFLALPRGGMLVTGQVVEMRCQQGQIPEFLVRTSNGGLWALYAREIGPLRYQGQPAADGWLTITGPVRSPSRTAPS